MAENPRIEELRRRVQADPASIAFAALAEEFRRVGRYEDAIETCRTGLQRHPAYLSARVTLGRALIETGEYDAAREQLETVLRSAPENLAAIRGLATINERLGHSAQMDPHLADMMKGHVESIRVAAIKAPPPPEPVVVPDPVVLAQAAPVEPEPESGPDPDTEAFLDSRESNFEPQFQPEPELEAKPDPQPEARVQPESELNPWAEAAAPAEPDLDLSLAAPLEVLPDADPDLAMMLETDREPESGTELDMTAASGLDPEVLATLGRLERFLDAIQSRRA